ncbi:MAG: T9SS type A sorting domain-containing protein [Bacteroidota bacterium]|nr:T9SS type A sorting domain-containing protein [Bacteroidota bacterium]
MDSQQISDSTCWVSDGSDKFYYNNNSTCLWRIEPESCDSNLCLHFISFDTEENNDVLKIYDAADNTLLESYSGHFEDPPPSVTSPSGKLFLTFSTNESVRGKGFLAYYGSIAGIAEADAIRDINISPNPAKTKLDISMSLIHASSIGISIMNMQGQMIMHIPAKKYQAGKQIAKLNLTDIDPGIYLIRIEENSRTHTKKLIIL